MIGNYTNNPNALIVVTAAQRSLSTQRRLRPLESLRWPGDQVGHVGCDYDCMITNRPHDGIPDIVR